MSLFSTTKSADRSPPHMAGPVVSAEARRTESAEAASLPRHLLVSLAGITAEVAILQRCADVPEDQAALETIIGRLDGLVDSIYAASAIPGGPSRPRTGTLSTGERPNAAVPVSNKS